MTTIRIDQQDYDLERLPEFVRDELVSLSFVQDELHRLDLLTASLRNAERVYADALREALERWKSQDGQAKGDDS